MKQITVETGQTIFDLAIQYYGAVEGVEFLIQDNPIYLDGYLITGQKLNIRNEVKNKVIAKEFENYVPTTGHDFQPSI